jgi:hypothetical protein
LITPNGVILESEFEERASDAGSFDDRRGTINEMDEP